MDESRIDLGDDMVLPFQIEDLGIRGRVVRLGPLVDRVLRQHNYPEPVSRMLGEALALTTMIGSALKFEGRFTFQTQGKGPVHMLVADYMTPDSEHLHGRIRGYAQMDEVRLATYLSEGKTSTSDLLGDGYLALTIDQGADMERYQGIVALDPAGLSASAHEYFQSSEQVATTIRLAAGPLMQRGRDGQTETLWRAGAIMLQHIASDGGITGFREEDETRAPTTQEENWNRASILLNTVEDHELLDPALASSKLLFRLFHEDGVRAFAPSEVQFACRCSRDRTRSVVASFDDDEIADMVLDGKVEVKCEFCSEVYHFAADELKEARE